MTTADQILDVKGLNCPMPLLKAQQTIKKMDIGQTLKIISTDRGSIKDFQSWAKAGKAVELLDQGEESDNGTTLYVHYVRKTK
jgi:TusA-related sulfurtransferase